MSLKQITRAPQPFDKVEALAKLLQEGAGMEPEKATAAAEFLLAKERRNLTKSIFYAGR